MTLTSDEKVALFREELSLIPLEDYKAWTEKCISMFPNYFFIIPASPSGKHHPYWTLGDGGLVRHTKAVALLASKLARTYLPENVEEKWFLSMAVSASILHDSFKYGGTFDYNMFGVHPYIPRTIFSKIPGLPPSEKDWLFKAIEAHMGTCSTGEWSGLPYLTVSLLKKNPSLTIVHMADYVSSRDNYIDDRFIEINKGIVKRDDIPKSNVVSDEVMMGLLHASLFSLLTPEEIEGFIKDISFKDLSEVVLRLGKDETMLNVEIGLEAVKSVTSRYVTTYKAYVR